MRYSTEHKAATRRRIIAAAGRRLKSDGIAGSGVSTLMRDAGLTNGAFYAHFASKDDLVAVTLAHELDGQLDRLQHTAPDLEGIERFVREYLSSAHCADRANGCPSAALLDEIGRSSRVAREAYALRITAIAEHLAAVVDIDAPAGARSRVLAALALMIGTVQLARVLDEATARADMLSASTDAALALLGIR